MASAVPGQQYSAGGAVANNGQQPPHTNSGNGVAAVPDSYFTESRKGEINELRNLLKGFAAERDNSRKRDIIKKVIAYMTLGIDVSRLFTEMMLAIETRYVRKENCHRLVVVVVATAAARIVFCSFGEKENMWDGRRIGIWNGLFLVFSPLFTCHWPRVKKTLANSSESSLPPNNYCKMVSNQKQQLSPAIWSSRKWCICT
jgi:hypothetical protein